MARTGPWFETDAHKLVGHLLMHRREHRADRGHDDVEGLGLEGQVLGVRLDPVELDAGLLRPFAASVEELGRKVARGHLGAGLRSRDRGVARSGGNVENAHARADPARLDEPRPERQQEGLDHPRVVARGPHLAMPALQLRVRSRHAYSFLVDARTLPQG